jgi:hypothetical protein
MTAAGSSMTLFLSSPMLSPSAMTLAHVDDHALAVDDHALAVDDHALTVDYHALTVDDHAFSVAIRACSGPI